MSFCVFFVTENKVNGQKENGRLKRILEKNIYNKLILRPENLYENTNQTLHKTIMNTTLL